MAVHKRPYEAIVLRHLENLLGERGFALEKGRIVRRIAQAREFIRREMEEMREESRRRGAVGDPSLGWRLFLEYLEKKGLRKE